MKKWKFLVATALVCGALTTVTSCIDNDEPAGISDLRGAKAELIKAQAALKLVEVEYQKVNVEIQSIKLEKEKVQLQIDQYNAEMLAAKTEYEKEQWAQKKAAVIAEYEGTIYNLKKIAAENQAAYEKALADLQIAQLTAKNDAFSAKITLVLAQINGLRTTLKTAQDNVLDGNATLVDLLAKNNDEALRKDTLAVFYAQAAIDTKQKEIDALTTFKETDFAEWKSKADALKDSIAEVSKAIANKQIEMDEYDEKMTPYTVAITQLNTQLTTSVDAEQPEIAEEIESDITAITPAFPASSPLEDMSQDLTDHADAVKDAYDNILFGLGYDNASTENLAAASKDAKSLMDATYAAYQADSTDWKTKFDAFKIALGKYGYTYSLDGAGNIQFTELANSAWKKANDAITDFLALTTPATADEDKVAKAVRDYAELRKAIDGFTVNNTATADQAALITDINGSGVAVLGSSSFASNDGTYGDWRDASNKAFGKLAQTIVSDPTSGSYFKYLEAADAKELLDNIDKWIAYETAVRALIPSFETQMKDVKDAIAAKEAEKKPLQDAYDALSNQQAVLNAQSAAWNQVLTTVKGATLDWVCNDPSNPNYLTVKRIALSGIEALLKQAEKDLNGDGTLSLPGLLGNLATAKENLAILQKEIAEGADALTVSIKKQENQNAIYEAQLAEYQKQLDILIAEKDALIEALNTQN